jgi:MFS family permease
VPAVVLTLAAALVLADGPLVTLALPDLVHDLHTTVQGVAAVLAVYIAVLAVAVLAAGRLVGSRSARWLGASGFAVMAAASILCAASGSLAPLLIGRAVQAAGGAVGLAAAFVLHDGGAAGRRRWIAASVLGAAAGPALGGALTQAFDWHAIFIAQAPIAALGAFACLRLGAVEAPPADASTPAGSPVGASAVAGSQARALLRPAIALACVSAALIAVLFLLVLLLIAGWATSPLGAAALVSVLPVAAIGGERIRAGDPWLRGAVGCALVGAGVLALAWLPGARLAWTVVPQILAGIGMGLALPALAGELLPERNVREATRALAIRHAGMALVLLALAPIVAHQLDSSTERARERGVALVLDAKLSPVSKLRLAPALLGAVQARSPRAGLRHAIVAQRAGFSGSDLVAYNELARRADDTLVQAVAEAFRLAFVVGGALALIAALLLAPAAVRRSGALAVALALVVAVPGAYALADRSLGPKPVVIQNPCGPRSLPGSGGITGFLQDRVLELLDTTACQLHSTREELVLALADRRDAQRFKQRHGVDPRSVGGLVGALLGLG